MDQKIGSDPLKTTEKNFKINDVSIFVRIAWLCNLIYHQAVAVLTCWFLWLFFKNYDLSSLRSWHVILSTFAYIPFMAQGIILFGGDNLWTQRLERTKKYWLHGILLGIGVVLVSAGIIVETVGKNKRGRPHFGTDHAITGLASWIFGLASIFLGIFSWHSPKLKRILKPVVVKFIHNFMGLGCFSVGIASLILSFEKGTFLRLGLTTTETQVTIWMTAILTVWSSVYALESCYNLLKTMC